MFRRSTPRETRPTHSRSVVLVRLDGDDLPADGSGEAWLLESGDVVIGRDEVCDVQIVDSMISRRHILLRHDSGADSFLARDLDSANGTLVNGQPLHEEHLLVDGDVLELGNSALRFTGRHIAEQLRGLHIPEFGQGHLGTMAGPLDE